jgi:hypothetical protein
MSVPRPGPSLNLKITRACKGTPPHYQPSTFLFQMVPFPPFFSQTAKVDTRHHQSTMHISLARGLFPGENRNNHCSASASTQVRHGFSVPARGSNRRRQDRLPAGYVYVRVPATTGGNACMVPEIGSQLTQAHAWHGWICYHQRALYSSVRAWRAAEADDDLADPACRDVTAHISSYN